MEKNMGLKVIIAFLTFAIMGMFYVLVWAWNNNDSVSIIDEQVSNTWENKSDESENVKTQEEVKKVVKADKIEIIEFHNTQRCATCLKAEELLKKTLDTKFSSEVKNWVIGFKDINIELPENAEISNKFQATGLSVAINSITSWKDNIEYDMWGWQLISNEDQYITYFEKKINNLLGK